MKSIIFINNTYHNYSDERLSFEVGQLEWYCERKDREVHKVLIVNNKEELEEMINYLETTHEIGQGDGVITLEVSDISKDNNKIKDFILLLCDRGINFRAFHEYFNNETGWEKDLLINCIGLSISTKYSVPF